MEELNSSWHSYPKVFAFGHKVISNIFDDEVIIEEKLDGSQFSFGIFNGEIKCRSKGVVFNTYAIDKMFTRAVEVVNSLKDKLTDGWTYRGEYFAKPKHNTLAYDRIPLNHIMIFDVNIGQENYLSYEDKKKECERLGLECMPLLYQGKVETPEFIRSLLDRVSVLGGQKIEGVVAKNYKKFTPDGKAMIGKFVSEEFKEVNNSSFRERNPGSGDIVEILVSKYKNIARWNKAIQHLTEEGKLQFSPTDIKMLLDEAIKDIKTECEDEIKQELFDWAWKNISRRVVNGFPEYYKEFLLKKSFETPTEETKDEKTN